MISTECSTTDSLTLVSLAEAAGVSRPVVYDHFGTRPGLLIALYRRLDERHRAAAEAALRDAPAVPREIARVLSAAYFACATDMPEWTAISAALKGNQEMEAIERELLDGYTDLMARALRPYTELTQEALRLRCVGVLGAAEAIAAELNRGRATAAAAIAALTDLTVDGIAAGSLGDQN
ncbi:MULTISPECIES: TetR/AcrR family transcriptional regulator [Nonomuraea]|uniref:TetR/AcrR family transcriptional regulator n=1 Tax=Nonomuraea ferruginea TaxID=46174 RepID=A0ABT4T6Z9_9ACTN|nr:TetR/AcrR family transcriptional regulator [Nonomuraea ferruginea]MDA0644930.1 TetR/AcrR family transcriptional regulator [Nonomuraea ferruginea]